jgi:hypothetical protein
MKWLEIVTVINLIATALTAFFAFRANNQRKKEYEDLRKDRDEDFGRTFVILRVIVNDTHNNLIIALSNENTQKNLDIARLTVSDGAETVELGVIGAPLDGYFETGQVKTVQTTPLFKKYGEFLNKNVSLVIVDGYGNSSSVEFLFRKGEAYSLF